MAACNDYLFTAPLDCGFRLYRQKPGHGIADIVSCHSRQDLAGCALPEEPLKERFALGALRLRSVPSELEAFLHQAQRSSSETLIERSAPSAVHRGSKLNKLNGLKFTLQNY